MNLEADGVPRSTWPGLVLRYALTVAMVALASVARWRLERTVGPMPLFITWYPAVLIAATVAGGGPGVVTTLLSVLAADYWFISPIGSFKIDAPHDVVATVIFAGMCLFVSLLAERLRRLRWVQAFADAKAQESVELAHQNEELVQQSEELARQNETISQQSAELTQQNEELQVRSEEIRSLNEDLGNRETLLQKMLDSARLSSAEELVMREICAAGMGMFGDVAAVVAYEQEGQQLTVRAQAGLGDLPSVTRKPLERSFAALVMKENRTGSLNDASLRPDLALLAIPGRPRFDAVLCAPLRAAGQPFGAVAVYSRCKRSWTDEQFRLAEWLAAQCGRILETLRLQRDLRASEQRVRLKLDSILAPEGDIGNLELADIVDTKAIQELMDHFYKLARMPMAIIDRKGKVLVGAGWQDICTKFHRAHPETCRHCIESDTRLSSGVSPGDFKLYKCKNHMWDVATPILVGGQHMGNVFSGQFFFEGEPLEYELFRTQARQYGFDEKDYLAALERVPRLSREQMETGMAYFTKLAGMISKLSYSNIKLARSLTERDRLMESLNESREQLNRAQEIAHLGSWELNLVNNRLSWSDEVYRIFGLRPQEFGATYDAFLEAIHPDDRAAVDAAYSNSLRDGRSSYEIEHRVVRKAGGEVRWVHEKCAHLQDVDGRVIRSIGMVLDITERKRQEEALRRSLRQFEVLAEELARSNKDLEQFAYVTSHDLKEPLRMVTGFMGLLKDHGQGRLDAKADEYIGFAVDASLRMQGLVDDLLAYSRAGRGPATESADASLAVELALKNLSASIKEAAGAVAFEPLPVVMANELELTQVFQNLIGNAIKFRRPGVLPQVHVGAKREPNRWVFSVRDNGIGIAPEYIGKIFMIFQRLHTREEYPGTGVGLAICKKIVERHGGRIWVESRLEEGSVFYFIIPDNGKELG